MGFDTVESAAYLSCAFLNALLEEAPAVKAELTQQLERFIRGTDASAGDRGGGRGRRETARRREAAAEAPRARRGR